MAPSDTAEYWHDARSRKKKRIRFVHIPRSKCGHIKHETGNTDTSKYLSDITCFACLRLLKENGNVYGLMDRLAKKAKKKNKQRVVNPVVNKLPEYLIYIDGACDRNGQVGNSGGHGYVVVKNDEIVEELVEYEDNTTNNRQELMAALSAIRWVVSNQISDYVIYSDSQYAVNSITNWIHSWKKNGWVTSNKTPVLNKDILLLILEEIAWLKTVNMKWIKGHDGNKWNEYIDRLVQ